MPRTVAAIDGASQFHRDAEWRDRRTSPPPQKLARLTLALLAFLFFLAAHAHAQGCSQCLDNTRATPPVVQAAYRHAILLLGGVGASLFIAGILFLRRER